MASNSKQNIITAIAIIVALAAVVYAFMQQGGKTVTADNNGAETVVETTEENYEEGDENPVVLQVNGRDITRMEIMDNFASSGSQIPEGANMEQVFPLLQEQYLIAALLNNAAVEAGVDGTNPEVAERVEEARKQAVRAVYIDQISDNAVTENDVRKTYDDIVANSEPIVERKARHILVETEEEANSLIEQLDQGADFAELARENSTGPSASNGGDLGYFAPGSMVPAFSEVAFSTPVGEYAKEPVQTQFGYHVIMVEDQRTREKPSFDEMKDQIEQSLRQAVIREKIQELRQNTEVVVYDYAGNPVPEPAAGDATEGEEVSTESEANATSETATDSEADDAEPTQE